MAAYWFKIKGYLNEPGEYSEFHAADSGTIIQFVLQYWFNEMIPNNLDIIIIKNENGDQLVLDHFKKDVFAYYWIPANARRQYYYKKTDIQFMFFALESFFNARFEDLKLNLTPITSDFNEVTGDFIGRDFTYQVNRKLIVRNIDIVIFPLLLIVACLIASFFTSFYVLAVGAAFGVLFLLGSVGHFIRLKKYYDDNKAITIRFSRGSDVLRITKGEWKKDIPKSEVRKITKYVHPMNDSRNLAEYHTEIEFLNGNILNLSCLLISQDEIETKFANDLIPVDHKIWSQKDEFKPTRLDNYFSAVRPT